MTAHPCLPTAGRWLSDQSAGRCWAQAGTGGIPAKKFSGSRLHFLRATTKFATASAVYNVHPVHTSTMAPTTTTRAKKFAEWEEKPARGA